MKSKYQIWAHLMRVPYSYSARKKISKFLKAHEELDLIPQMQGKCGIRLSGSSCVGMTAIQMPALI